MASKRFGGSLTLHFSQRGDKRASDRRAFIRVAAVVGIAPKRRIFERGNGLGIANRTDFLQRGEAGRHITARDRPSPLHEFASPSFRNSLSFMQLIFITETV